MRPGGAHTVGIGEIQVSVYSTLSEAIGGGSGKGVIRGHSTTIQSGSARSGIIHISPHGELTLGPREMLSVEGQVRPQGHKDTKYTKAGGFGRLPPALGRHMRQCTLWRYARIDTHYLAKGLFTCPVNYWSALLYTTLTKPSRAWNAAC